MRVKKIKRICGVRGCKNTHNVYALSQRNEMGNSVIMCEDCMKDALKAVAEYTEPTKAKKEPEIEVTLSSVADEEPELVEVVDAVAEDIHTPVAEDTVTIEEPIIDTVKPEVVLPTKATTATSKKKPNKKK